MLLIHYLMKSIHFKNDTYIPFIRVHALLVTVPQNSKCIVQIILQFPVLNRKLGLKGVFLGHFLISEFFCNIFILCNENKKQMKELLNKINRKKLGLFQKTVYFLKSVYFLVKNKPIFRINQISFKSYRYCL